MDNDFVKCTSKEGGYSVTRCSALVSVLEYFPRPNSKGLFGKHIVNIETSEHLGVMVVAKLGSYRRTEGIALNVCPFCGGSLIGP